MLSSVAPPDVAQRLAHGIVGMAEGTCRYWLAREPDVEPEQLAEDVARLLWAGLSEVNASFA